MQKSGVFEKLEANGCEIKGQGFGSGRGSKGY